VIYQRYHVTVVGSVVQQNLAGSKSTAQAGKKSSATKQFLTSIASSLGSIEEAGADSGRLLTVFRIKLESVKKIETADVVAGISGKFAAEEYDGPLIIQKITDPNTTHPFRQKELLKAIGTLHGKPFTSHAFQALCRKFGFKADPKYCWMDSKGAITEYSNGLINQIRAVTASELHDAIGAYKKYLTQR
jgi:EC042_2821-lke REase